MEMWREVTDEEHADSEKKYTERDRWIQNNK
jgi:hypothetical protein